MTRETIITGEVDRYHVFMYQNITMCAARVCGHNKYVSTHKLATHITDLWVFYCLDYVFNFIKNLIQI